ncbi:phosphatase PAP2 family protein [bacterium]|nr:phosphatase PAP2 family protein [bacterium]
MDQIISQQLNAFVLKYFWQDVFFIFFAEYLAYFLGAASFLFLLVNFKKYWPMVVKGLAAGLLARFGIVEVIRFFWHRTRPFLETGINLLVAKINQPAFPSGHAAFFFALSFIVFLYNKKAGLLFFIGSFLICLGRVIVGLHWPTDILGGAVVGLFSAWLVHRIFRK